MTISHSHSSQLQKLLQKLLQKELQRLLQQSTSISGLKRNGPKQLNTLVRKFMVVNVMIADFGVQIQQ